MVKEFLELDKIEVVLDDVRNINSAKYGKFDFVLCLGILYHLDAPDCFRLIEKLSEVTESILIIDTQICLIPSKTYDFENLKISGRHHIEHRKKASDEEKKRDTWLSIDNVRSFWMTNSSILNLFQKAGFTTSYECRLPHEEMKLINRRTYVAIKGKKALPLSSFPNPDNDIKIVPETGVLYHLKFWRRIIRNSLRFHIGKYMPQRIKRFKRRLMNQKV